VAFARAIAPHPKVLLLDEPLSALDLKLRQAMRLELKRLQRETGITFIFVTHDQEEALTMSDRIAVMSAGHVQQVGTPLEIYERPVNRFVADFIGDSNFLYGVVEKTGRDGALIRITPNFSIEISAGNAAKGDKVSLALRPEKVKLTKLTRSMPSGRVREAVYVGTSTTYLVELDGGVSITVREGNSLSGQSRFAAGDQVGVVVEAGAARLLAG
jgi:spermidine/putrescine transport system ATP-binding protein